MTGFQIPLREAVIDFEEGHLYHGLEVKVKLDVPYSFLLKIRAALLAEDEEQGIELNREWVDRVLLSWNVEDDDGKPVEPTFEAISEYPAALLNTLQFAWIEEAQSIPAPLGRRSTEPEQSGES